MGAWALVLCSLAVLDVSPPDTAPPGGIDLDPRKHLSDEDYERKVEGGYVTGLPLAAYDPNFGFGAGARAYYYWNGSRTDTLFPFTPYFQRIFLQGFASSKGMQFHWLDYDAPYVFDSPYRLRGQLIYERNLAHNYFGLGSRALGAFTSPVDGQHYQTFDAYDATLRRTDTNGQTLKKYDQFDLQRPILFMSLERTFLAGTLRPLAGAVFSHATVKDYTGTKIAATGAVAEAHMGQTRLNRDCAADLIHGCNGGWDNALRFGLSYDTRDFEPDPNSGVFVDVALDVGTAALGGDFTYVRALASGRIYYSPFPELTDLVLALRGTYEAQSHSAPFFSMDFMPFTEDPRAGLGGLRTLRGFLQDRFVGPVMTLVNGEVRWTFTHFSILSQRFALIAVPFFDTGRVFDDVSQTSLHRWQPDIGGALRIAWNQATIVCVDYGRSAEGSGLYINFNHIF